MAKKKRQQPQKGNLVQDRGEGHKRGRIKSQVGDKYWISFPGEPDRLMNKDQFDLLSP